MTRLYLITILLICFKFSYSQEYIQKVFHINGFYDYKCKIQKELPILEIEGSSKNMIRFWYKDYIIELVDNKIKRILVQTSIFKRRKEKYVFKGKVYKEVDVNQLKNDTLYFVGYNWQEIFNEACKTSYKEGCSHLCNIEISEGKSYFYFDIFMSKTKEDTIIKFLDLVRKQYRLDKIYSDLINCIKCGYSWEDEGGYSGFVKCPRWRGLAVRDQQ